MNIQIYMESSCGLAVRIRDLRAEGCGFKSQKTAFSLFVSIHDLCAVGCGFGSQKIPLIGRTSNLNPILYSNKVSHDPMTPVREYLDKHVHIHTGWFLTVTGV